MPKPRYITVKKFNKLKVGDKVVIRYMIGDAVIASEPISNPDDELRKECIDVRFNSGPWKGRTLNLIRQQISNTNKSFPPRKEYKKR